jgi:hypothetical protein
MLVKRQEGIFGPKSHEHPLVPPQLTHLKQLPLGIIRAPHVTQAGAPPDTLEYSTSAGGADRREDVQLETKGFFSYPYPSPRQSTYTRSK